MPAKVRFRRSSTGGQFLKSEDSRTSKSTIVIVKHGTSLEPRTIQIRKNSGVNIYTAYLKGKVVSSDSTAPQIVYGTAKKER